MPRNTAVFAPTFRGEGIVRSPDITKDPRFGKNDPYFGMPKGHLPVRSYLAAPVVSRGGEVLGGLFFGHPEPDMFDARAERIVAAIAVQAAIAIDKARLYRAAQDEIERRKEIENALRESERSWKREWRNGPPSLLPRMQAHARSGAARARRRALPASSSKASTDYALFMLDPTGIVTNWNAGAQRIKGYRGTEIVGQNFENFYTPEDQRRHVPARALEAGAREGKYRSRGLRVRKTAALLGQRRPRSDPRQGGRFSAMPRSRVTLRNAGRRRRRCKGAQEQLAGAEDGSIGQLTGGIAHDFNNLLTSSSEISSWRNETCVRPPPTSNV